MPPSPSSMLTVRDPAVRTSAPAGTPRAILVVAPQPFFEDRGTPIAVLRVVRALREAGYDVDVLTFPVGREVDCAGARVIRTPNPLGIRHVPVGFSLRKLALDASLVPALARQLARRDYAAVHALEESVFPALWLAGRRAIPVVYDMQSSLPEQLTKHPALRPAPVQRLLRAAERWALTRAARVVSFTGLAASIRRHTPAARVREWGHATLLAPAAGGDGMRGELGLAEGTPVVLYSGTFERYQGLPLLLDAVPAVRARHPRATFVLLGADGRAGQEMRREVAARGLGEAVRVVDRQPQERLPGYLATADVLVSPRAYGGNTPLKSYDYLAAGRPIVATDIPAHRAVLTDRTALLVRPEAGALADGIARLLAEPERASALAAGAREYAAAALRWPAFVERVGAMYGELCAPQAARVPA